MDPSPVTKVPCGICERPTDRAAVPRCAECAALELELAKELHWCEKASQQAAHWNRLAIGANGWKASEYRSLAASSCHMSLAHFGRAAALRARLCGRQPEGSETKWVFQ